VDFAAAIAAIVNSFYYLADWQHFSRMKLVFSGGNKMRANRQ
jgi:hypothetical protein